MAPQPQGRVLIIEDDRLFGWALSRLAECQGYRVVGVAVNPAEAVALAREARPTLILSDLNLVRPGDGADAVREILGILTVPVVFVTGSPDAVPRSGRLSDAVVLPKWAVPGGLAAAIAAASAPLPVAA